MIKGHELRTTHVILLAVAINALAVALWFALTSIFPIRITPGFGLSHGIAAGADWVEIFGPSILWLALFAVAGVLVAARMCLMRWVHGAPASVEGHEASGARPRARDGAMSHETDGAAAQRTRATLKS